MVKPNRQSVVVFCAVFVAIVCGPAFDAQAQQTQTTLSPAYKRARLRKLLEEWESRYPIVERQIEVSKSKVDELAPQVGPAKQQADTLRDQTRIAREKVGSVTDAVVAELGASRGFVDLEQALALAEAELASIAAAVREKLADDPDYKLQRQAVDAATQRVNAIKGDPDVSHEQRLAIVAAELAARNEMIAHENAALEADPSYATAKAKTVGLRSRVAKLRTEVMREAAKDRRVELAERAARDAQRATVEASKRSGKITRDFRLYLTRLDKAKGELASLERQILNARHELGRAEVLP